MADPDNAVLDFLRENFKRINTKLDLMAADVTNLKARVSGLETDIGYIRVALGELNSRVDRIDGRLARLETAITHPSGCSA